MPFDRILRALPPVLLCACLAACDKPAEPPQPEGPRTEGDSIVFPAGAEGLQTLRSHPVHMEPIPVTTLNGRVTWNEERTVRVYTPLTGRVVRLLAQPGDRVAAGQPLALIASADIAQAQADAGRADAEVALTEKTLARMRELEQHGVVARKDLQAAEADHARAAAELARARQRLSLYGATGERGVDLAFTLRSPIAGVVVERNLNPGQELRSDQGGTGTPALFVVTDPTALWVVLDAAERDLPILQRGKRVRIRAPAYGDTDFPGVIENVTDFIDPATRTIKVRVSIANPERRLKSEMYVLGLADHGDAKELLVPSKSVYFQNDRHCLFVEDGDGRFTRRTVRVGDVRNDRVEILEGLSEGDKVVTEGVLMLQQVLKPRRVQK